MFCVKNILLLLLFSFQSGSNSILTEIEKKLNNGEIGKADELLKKISPEKLLIDDQALYYYLKADINTRKNVEDEAYRDLLTSKKLYLKANNIEKAMDINIDIAYLI